MKRIAFLAGVCSALVITGCIAQPSSVNDDSVVELRPQVGHSMTARRLDGEDVQKINQFRMPPGKHDLEVGIVREGYQQSRRRCLAYLSYENFSPNSHYAVTETSPGLDAGVILVDGAGKTVAEARGLPCL